MGWTAALLPDLRGRTAVVTGGNSGIGFQTARALAAHGARVVLACRRADAGTAAAERLARSGAAGPAAVSAAVVDLSSMASVRAFGEAWDGPLDLLVNNAGVMAPPRLTRTADGFERQFAVNHLGHFVLTGLLLPALEAAGGRVVTVSSIVHAQGTAAVVDGNVGELYHPQRTYANSKLANLLFAVQLHRELTARGARATSTAAHPGVAATGLFSSREGIGARPAWRVVAPAVARLVTQRASAGARAVLYAACVAAPGSYTGPRLLGGTRGPVGPARMSRLAGDEDLARRLWRVSEDLTGFRYDWAALGGDAPARP